MKKIMSLLAISAISMPIYALELLADNELQNVEGQAGADLSLNLSLNHAPLNQVQLNSGDKPAFTCGGTGQFPLEYCRLALSLNKRYVNPTPDVNNYPTGWAPSSESGYKLWLVAKGIQGTVNFQLIGLDGIKLNQILGGGKYTIDSNKPAIQLGMKASKPIQIRGFGFESLSIERDNFTTSAAGVEVGSNIASNYGYLKTSLYDSTNAAGSNFDWGRETGFVGMTMHGNLALQGKIMMFSCDSTHPRC